MKYNYYEAVTNDVKAWIKENANYYDEFVAKATNSYDGPGLTDELFMLLCDDDYITGNASGSYTCSTYTAQEYLKDNLELLVEAIEDLGDSSEMYKDCLLNPEYGDVTIRYYVLPTAISEALKQLNDAGYFTGRGIE